MSRPQFTLKTLLWLMAVVAALFGGMAIQHKLDRPVPLLRTLFAALFWPSGDNRCPTTIHLPLLVAMLVVAAFFGGIRFERELEERRRKQDLGNCYYDQVRPPRSPLIVEIFDPTGEWAEAE